MTAIADNSSMTVWPWWVWTALALVGAGLLFWIEYRRDLRVKRRRAMERHPSNHVPIKRVHPYCVSFGHKYIPSGRYFVCGVCDDAVARLIIENPDDLEMWERELSEDGAA